MRRPDRELNATDSKRSARTVRPALDIPGGLPMGRVTDENAHPHLDQSGKLALIHNGVIENFQQLRDQLLSHGHTFRSETDTEVLAHLIGHIFDGMAGPRNKQNLLDAFRLALKQVIGTYGLALFHVDVPDVVLGARRGSPLILGVGKGQNFIVSDVSAIVAHTRDVVYLDDYDVVAIERDQFDIISLAGADASFQVSKVEFTTEDVDKGAYPHYMLKEIFEQPNAIRDAMRGRLSIEECTAKLGGLNMSSRELRDVDRIVLTACGTALHAARVGECLIESLAHIPTEVEFASEFRYRNMPMNKDTLVFAISQSGETIDTLAALRESKRKGHRTLGICNNVGSTIAAGKRWRCLHACRSGDRSRGDQKLHLASRDSHLARPFARTYSASCPALRESK